MEAQAVAFQYIKMSGYFGSQKEELRFLYLRQLASSLRCHFRDGCANTVMVEDQNIYIWSLMNVLMQPKATSLVHFLEIPQQKLDELVTWKVWN